MQTIVTELPIEDAVLRARRQLRQADERLSRALQGSARGLPWLGLGMLTLVAGACLQMGAFPLSVHLATPIAAAVLALGGALLGYGVPLWARARRHTRQRAREWRHALQMLRLREQQAQEDPELSVEVLERIDGPRASPLSAWRRHAGAGSRYVQ